MLNLKNSILVLLTLLLVSSCGSAQHKSTGSSVQTIDAQKFYDLMRVAPDAQVMDVRTPREFSVGHLPQAKNNNIGSPAFVEEAQKLDKNRPVFVYCRTGVRSERAAHELAKLGFKEVYDLGGGIMAWQRAGLKTEMRP